VIDERSGMAAVGDMNAYLKFKAAKAMGDAAEQGGEGGGNVSAGLGVGMGAGMGMMLPQMMKEAMQDSGQGGTAGGAAPSNPEPGDQTTTGAAAAGAATLFCHQCGQGLPEGARFCPSCGTKVAE
jgi:membrane protease subunit (stomatin/prohibitin family)